MLKISQSVQGEITHRWRHRGNTNIILFCKTGVSSSVENTEREKTKQIKHGSVCTADVILIGEIKDQIKRKTNDKWRIISPCYKIQHLLRLCQQLPFHPYRDCQTNKQYAGTSYTCAPHKTIQYTCFTFIQGLSFSVDFTDSAVGLKVVRRETFIVFHLLLKAPRNKDQLSLSLSRSLLSHYLLSPRAT